MSDRVEKTLGLKKRSTTPDASDRSNGHPSVGLAMRDDRLKTGRTGVRWRPAWRWPKETERFIADLLEKAPRPVLHVCSGASRLGDVRADLYHPGADVAADIYNLPFASGSFGTVLADPPFPLDGTTLPDRLRMVQEMGRVVRRDGWVVIHAPWLPSPTWGVLEDVWIRETSGHAFPMPPVMLSVWRRTLEPPERTEVPTHA